MYKIATLAGAALIAASASQAAIVVDVFDSGPNLVVSYEGTFDTSSGTFETTQPTSPQNFLLDAGSFGVRTGNQTGAPMNDYNLFFTSRPSTDIFKNIFGFTGALFGGTGSGTPLLFENTIFDQIWVPTGYQSGDLISGSNTFAGASLASIGAVAGSYTWTWSNGTASDSLTMNVATAPIPLPATGALLLAGLAAFGAARRLRGA